MKAFVFVTALAWASSVRALTPESEAEDVVAEANDVLTPLPAVNVQNYFTSAQNNDTNVTANTLNLRGIIPIGRHIIRLTAPLVTVPVVGQDSKSGLGDIVLFDAILLSGESKRLELAIGPQMTFPSATHRLLGQGKWQAGGILVLLTRVNPAVQLSCLIAMQASFAGDSSRQSVAQLTAQPIAIFHLVARYYLRSSGILSFNFSSGQYVVPLGFGVGKVVESQRTLVNIYLEPQFTVLHFGATQPALQIFGGINIQFR